MKNSIVTTPVDMSKVNDSSTTSTRDNNGIDDGIVIHVCDESRKINRDFRCSKKVLLAEMKYFKTYLSGTSAYDDIDISVHCDVHIFDWLMQYVKALHASDREKPKLDTKSVVSILISSEFLEMGDLVTRCLKYVHENINSIIKMPIDLNCINSKLLARLSKMLSVEELEAIVDKRNKIVGKLWMKRLEVMLEDSKKSIKACKYCHKVFATGFGDLLECPKAKPFIDFHGNVIARHEPYDDKSWSMRVYIKALRSKKMLSWCQVYWKIWGLTHGLYCKVNDTFFPFAEANACLYHPKAPIFRPGENTGSHPCCGEQAYRFDTAVRKTGCQARPYVPRISGPADEKLFEIYSKRSKAIAMEVNPSNIDDEENFNLGYLGSTEGTVNNGPDSASDGTQSDTDSVKSASSSHNGYENKNKTDKRRRYSSSGGKSGRHSRGSKSKKLESKKSASSTETTTTNNNNNNADGTSGGNSSSLPLRKWKRHSTLHYESLEQPPTPEQYKVNPQRRRMWRIDLQREEDVLRMQILMEQLSASRKAGTEYQHQYLNL